MCGHVPAGCVLLSPCSVRSLCFPESVSARMGNRPNQSVLCHVYCEYIIILYNLQPWVLSCLQVILYLPNLTIIAESTTSELLIVPIGLDMLTEYIIIFIITV